MGQICGDATGEDGTTSDPAVGALNLSNVVL